MTNKYYMGEKFNPPKIESGAAKEKEPGKERPMFIAEFSVHHVEHSDASEETYTALVEVMAESIEEAQIKAKGAESELGQNDEMGRNTYTFNKVYQGHVKENRLSARI